jgi:formamidopyrimidine-DNA glycosylase
MTGSFVAYETARERPRYWKIELAMEDGLRLAMPDARRLGRLRLIRDPDEDEPLSRLGGDALLGLPSAKGIAALLSRRRAPIKAVLLDQRLFAGVGNWIADEVLYQARISPRRLACDLDLQEVRRLRSRLRAIVRRACEVDADKDRFPRGWLFHVRWRRQKDARTRKGERLVHETIGGRTTAWVPGRQR